MPALVYMYVYKPYKNFCKYNCIHVSTYSIKEYMEGAYDYMVCSFSLKFLKKSLTFLISEPFVYVTE